MHSNEEAAPVVRALREGGIPAALRLLNARTPHRFTAIFKFSAETLENLFLYDREDSDARPWQPIPVDHSFCSIIRDTGTSFTVANASIERDVENHPARHKIISYCGVPLHDSDGHLFGSLCHFDFRPFLHADLDLELLRTAAPLLMQALSG